MKSRLCFLFMIVTVALSLNAQFTNSPVIGKDGSVSFSISAPGADTVRHEVVADGVVSVLAVGRSGAGLDALAVVGHGLPIQLGGEGGFSRLLDGLLHDGNPLS